MTGIGRDWLDSRRKEKRERERGGGGRELALNGDSVVDFPLGSAVKNPSPATWTGNLGAMTDVNETLGSLGCQAERATITGHVGARVTSNK